MHSRYFESLQAGIVTELDILSPEGKLAYITTLESLLVPNEKLCTIFLNCVLEVQNGELSPPLRQAFEEKSVYYIRYLHGLSPLNAEALSLLQRIETSPEREKQCRLLQALCMSESDQRRVELFLGQDSSEKALALLENILRASSANVEAACWLLRVCGRHGLDFTPWLQGFVCPKALLPLWNAELFQATVRAGQVEQALERWEAVPSAQRSSFLLNMAAEMSVRVGNLRQAVRCYSESLQKNPTQIPVRLRLQAITNPLRPDADLLTRHRTVICLYSWNKGALLETTLRSLAACDVGAAPIYVLLNGCTDDSRARVESLRDLLAPSPLHIVELPINIGAPAARNWLLALPEVAKADYVAFMDDDIEVPPHWLSAYLTVMERDPTIGAVGCKVVSPVLGQSLPHIQYFYRVISLAMEGLLKLSIAQPGGEDTGLYEFTRPCMNVMGCLHLLRGEAVRKLGGFDLRFSPSQLDDIDHDLRLCLHGYKVMYCGEVTCIHHQNSGIGAGRKRAKSAAGSVIGNDVKLIYKHTENVTALHEISESIRQQVEAMA